MLSDFTYAPAAGLALDATLRLQKVDDVDTLQLIDNADQSVLQSLALAETDAVNIMGGEQDDKLTVDFTSPFFVPIRFNDSSSADNDALEVRGGDKPWDITGKDAGYVAGVTFAGVENLIGAAGNRDTFVFQGGGMLSGILEGGAGGYDTLVIEGTHQSVVFNAGGPDSGSVILDGYPIRYAGLEPISVSGADTVVVTTSVDDVDDRLVVEPYGTSQIMVRATDPFGLITMETIYFDIPTGSLTVNPGTGNDIVEIAGNLIMPAADLTINAENHPGERRRGNQHGRDGGQRRYFLDRCGQRRRVCFGDPGVRRVRVGGVAGGEAGLTISGATLHGGNIILSAASEVTPTDEKSGFVGIAKNPLSDHFSEAFVAIVDSQITSSGTLEHHGRFDRDDLGPGRCGSGGGRRGRGCRGRRVDRGQRGDCGGHGNEFPVCRRLPDDRREQCPQRDHPGRRLGGDGRGGLCHGGRERDHPGGDRSSGGAVLGDSIEVTSTSNRTVQTTALSSKGGATQNSDPDKSPNLRTQGKATTSETGAEGVTAAAALAFTKMDGTTEAYIAPAGSAVTATKAADSAVNIAAKSSNNMTAEADAGTTKTAAAAGVERLWRLTGRRLRTGPISGGPERSMPIPFRSRRPCPRP